MVSKLRSRAGKRVVAAAAKRSTMAEQRQLLQQLSTTKRESALSPFTSPQPQVVRESSLMSASPVFVKEVEQISNPSAMSQSAAVARRLVSGATGKEHETPVQLTVDLRTHQIDGLRWMLLRERFGGLGAGGILADGIGIGKRVQALALAIAAQRYAVESTPRVLAMDDKEPAKATVSGATRWATQQLRLWNDYAVRHSAEVSKGDVAVAEVRRKSMTARLLMILSQSETLLSKSIHETVLAVSPLVRYSKILRTRVITGKGDAIPELDDQSELIRKVETMFDNMSTLSQSVDELATVAVCKLREQLSSPSQPKWATPLPSNPLLAHTMMVRRIPLRTLIVCLPSQVEHWVSLLQKTVAGASFYVYHLFLGRKKQKVQLIRDLRSLARYDFVITTHDNAVAHAEYVTKKHRVDGEQDLDFVSNPAAARTHGPLMHIVWNRIIVDDANYFNNWAALDGYAAGHRWLLTGSLGHVKPSQFDKMLSAVGEVPLPRLSEELALGPQLSQTAAARAVAHVVLRRSDAVAKSGQLNVAKLPPVTTDTIAVPPGMLEARLYNRLLSRLHPTKGGRLSMPKVMGMLRRLRQAATAPVLKTGDGCLAEGALLQEAAKQVLTAHRGNTSRIVVICEERALLVGLQKDLQKRLPGLKVLLPNGTLGQTAEFEKRGGMDVYLSSGDVILISSTQLNTDLDLTASKRLIVVGHLSRPEHREKAVRCIVRPGQVRRVHITQLLLRGSAVDPAVERLIPANASELAPDRLLDALKPLLNYLRPLVPVTSHPAVSVPKKKEEKQAPVGKHSPLPSSTWV